MAVEYGNSGPKIDEPIPRFTDENCGFKGVVVDSFMKDSYELVGTQWKQRFWNDNPDNPVQDFVFIVAVEAGRAYLPVIGPDGEPVKKPNGEQQVELTDIGQTDIAFVCSSGWSVKAVKSVKLNDGHQFTFRRTSPAGVKQVDCEIEVLGTVENPVRFNPPKQGPAVSYDAPFPDAAPQPAPQAPAQQVPNGGTQPQQAPVTSGAPAPW